MKKNNCRVYISYFWPDWWENFLHHCNDLAEINNQDIITVINQQLKPHGKFVKKSVLGSFICWNDPKHHTAFLLRWS